MIPMRCLFANCGCLIFKRYLLRFDLLFDALAFMAYGDVVLVA